MIHHKPDCGLNRETKMLRLSPDVWCDPCIAHLVRALNDGGVKTIASCCGHGHRPAWIALEGDQHMLIMSREDMYRVDALFPVDINGNKRPDVSSDPNPS